jgi:Na+/proline symporter
MNNIDFAIIGVYFTIMVLVGVFHARQASAGIRSYFLGDNQRSWWMLAASGAASNFDISGTMFQVSLFYVMGLRGFWMLWSWQLLGGCFLAAYMARWIRRTGVSTAVELMKVRFGTDRGGQMARTAGAVLMVSFLAFSIGYAFAGLAEFLPVIIPGLDAESGRMIAIAVMVATTLYTTMGGFSSVVIADVIQLALSSGAGIAIGIIVFLKLDPHLVSVLHNTFSIDPVPHRHMSLPEGYKNWENFGTVCIYLGVSGLLLNMSGAGGHYQEQRYLATRNDSDAAKAGAAWGLFLIPRYAMIAGMVFIAATGLVGTRDPEQILPIVVVDIVPPGLRGLIVAALFAAFMSSLGSTANSAASILVCDLVQPYMPRLPTKFFVTIGRQMTILLVAIGIMIGTQAASIKVIWIWMIAGIIGATLIPNVLRWHWWRFNGWGYAWGIFGGLGATAIIGASQALGWFGPLGLSEYEYAPVIWLAAAAGSVGGSLATQPTEFSVLRDFYERVRPFGAWGPVAAASSVVRPAVGPIAVNVILGLVLIVACNVSVFFIIGHYATQAEVGVVTALICAICLYFTWYKPLAQEAEA